MDIHEVNPKWEPLAPLTNVPADVEAMVAQAVKALRAGLIEVPKMRDGSRLGTLGLAETGIVFTPETLLELDIP